MDRTKDNTTHFSLRFKKKRIFAGRKFVFENTEI